MEGMAAAKRGIAYSSRRQRKPEVGLGYKTSRPTSFDSLPLIRLPSLKGYNLYK